MNVPILIKIIHTFPFLHSLIESFFPFSLRLTDTLVDTILIAVEHSRRF